MKTSFLRADDALIDRVFQPSVDWIADHTAFDGFTVARICIDLTALAWLVSQYSHIAETAASGNLGFDVPQFAITVVGLGAISVLRPLFQRTDRGGSGRRNVSSNPLRVGMYVHRAVGLLWLIGLVAKTMASPPGLASFALLGVGIFATTAMYFGACSNHPTKRCEIREGDGAWKLAPLRNGS